MSNPQKAALGQVGAEQTAERSLLDQIFGVTQSGTSAHGGGAGAGKSFFTDLHFVHHIAQASPVLFQKCASGEHLADALLTVRKAGGTQLEYLKIKLTDFDRFFRAAGRKPGWRSSGGTGLFELLQDRSGLPAAGS